MGERCGLETGKIRSGWRGQVRSGKERWVVGCGGGGGHSNNEVAS